MTPRIGRRMTWEHLIPPPQPSLEPQAKADGCNGCKSRSWCIAGSLSPCWLVTVFISILSSQPSLWTRWLPYVAQSSSALQHHIVDWPQTTCGFDSVMCNAISSDATVTSLSDFKGLQPRPLQLVSTVQTHQASSSMSFSSKAFRIQNALVDMNWMLSTTACCTRCCTFCWRCASSAASSSSCEKSGFLKHNSSTLFNSLN